MNTPLIIKALLGTGLSETDIKYMLEERGIKTSQPTLNRIKKGKAGKLDHKLVITLADLYKIYVEK